MPKKICEQCYFSAIAYMREQHEYFPYKSVFPENFTLNIPECEVHGMYSADILKEMKGWVNLCFSESVMSRCRQRLDLEPSDTSCDADIISMSKRDLLDECLQWEGIIGYRDLILIWIQDIYNVELKD